MYGWIWRHIPVRRAKFKALISLVLIGAIGALLWYKVFPAVEPVLPFDDGQIENSNGQPADGGQAPADNVRSPAPSGPTGPTSTAPIVIPS